MALFGGFLFQLTLGSWFCFGNLIPYVASYMTHNVNAENGPLSDDELAHLYTGFISNGNIVFFIAMILNALCCIFGGNLELQLGPTKTLMITGSLICGGFALTYFGLLWKSWTIIYITFGVIYGAGVGLGYPVQPIVCMRWFPEKVRFHPSYISMHCHSAFKGLLIALCGTAGYRQWIHFCRVWGRAICVQSDSVQIG